MKILFCCAPTLLLIASVFVVATYAQADVSAKTIARSGSAEALSQPLPCAEPASGSAR